MDYQRRYAWRLNNFRPVLATRGPSQTGESCSVVTRSHIPRSLVQLLTALAYKVNYVPGDVRHCFLKSCASASGKARWPPKNTMKLGMPRILKRPASLRVFPVSTLRTTAWPAVSAAVRATSGSAIRRGPHQPARKSTRTGTGTFWMISSNNTSSTARGSAIGGSGDLQCPQRPSLAKNVAGMRFFGPQ